MNGFKRMRRFVAVLCCFTLLCGCGPKNDTANSGAAGLHANRRLAPGDNEGRQSSHLLSAASRRVDGLPPPGWPCSCRPHPERRPERRGNDNATSADRH